MSTLNAPITSKNVDLSNCDRELIQFPGAVLPHGFLLTVQEPDLTVLQVSENAGAVFGKEPRALLGLTLDALLGAEKVQEVRRKSQLDPLQGAPTRVAVVRLKNDDWNILAHRNDQVLFLEFEPRSLPSEESVADLYSELRGAIAKIQNAKSSQELLDLTVHRVRAFTGFDRVMAYKFLADGSGSVRAESVRGELVSYLGNHFPPSDIPLPARRLFTMSWVRHQPDIGYAPVPIQPENNPLTGNPLDLSYAVLRSVSVMYTGYLKNMGTDASMVMTILKNGQLWGLIACHHHSGPKHVPYEVRAACEFLANIVSLLICEKEDLEFSEYKLKLKSTQSALVENMSNSGQFTDALMNGRPSILEFVRAGGAAACVDGKISLKGRTPAETQIRALAEFVSVQDADEIFATDSLASVYPQSQAYKDVASGLLAIRFSPTKKDFLFWFRPEVIQTVKWAGDPHKPVDYSSDGQRLLPRTSFALWIESVALKSEPWLPIEIQAARELRISILELVLRQAEQLGELYRNLERSHMELDAFAYVASHDLKEPLRGIHNYSQFLLEDCADRLRPEDLEKLKAMARLTKRMDDLLDSLLKYSRISRSELKLSTCDLNEIIADALENLSVRIEESSVKIRVPRPLPKIETDAPSITEVFSNLISNAIKYNNKPEKLVEIGFLERPGQTPVLFVRDNGIGIESVHMDSIFMIFRRLHGHNEFGGGTGAGLTITRKIVSRQGGKMWVESTPGVGSTFYFTVESGEERSEREGLN